MMRKSSNSAQLRSFRTRILSSSSKLTAIEEEPRIHDAGFAPPRFLGSRSYIYSVDKVVKMTSYDLRSQIRPGRARPKGCVALLATVGFGRPNLPEGQEFPRPNVQELKPKNFGLP